MFVVYNEDHPGSGPLGYGIDTGVALLRAQQLCAMIEKLEMTGNGLERVEHLIGVVNMQCVKVDTDEVPEFQMMATEYDRMFHNVTLACRSCGGMN